MRDDDGSTSLNQFVQCILHQRFTFTIQRRRSFVQDQQGSVLEEGSGDGNTLW